MGITIYIIAFFVILFILIIRQPDEFRVSRSMPMRAAPEKIFPHINNLKAWGAWSPWVKMEPTALMSFEGPEEGEGAIAKWKGKKTGQGIMTILESRPYSLVRYRLQFIKPMKAVNEADITLTPDGDSTTVIWTMYGPNSFIGKAMSLFMNCEAMVGSQFLLGLNDIKRIVEKK